MSGMVRMSRRLALVAQAIVLIAGPVHAVERPAPPAQTMPPAPEASVCDNRTSRQALLAEADERIGATFAAGLAITTYGQNLVHWKTEQLQARAQLSADEAAAFGSQAGANATNSAAAQDGLAATQVFIAATERFDEARRRNNDGEACRALVDALVAVHRIVGSTDAQWRHIAAAYDAEAARRGVTLD